MVNSKDKLKFINKIINHKMLKHFEKKDFENLLHKLEELRTEQECGSDYSMIQLESSKNYDIKVKKPYVAIISTGGSHGIGRRFINGIYETNGNFVQGIFKQRVMNGEILEARLDTDSILEHRIFYIVDKEPIEISKEGALELLEVPLETRLEQYEEYMSFDCPLCGKHGYGTTCKGCGGENLTIDNKKTASKVKEAN